MNLAGIDEDDYIVVQKNADANVGDIVVALDDDSCNIAREEMSRYIRRG